MKVYESNIFISSKAGGHSIIRYANKRHIILTNDWYNERSQNVEEEEFRILQAAAEIIRRRIRTEVCLKESYPASYQMFCNINESILKPCLLKPWSGLPRAYLTKVCLLGPQSVQPDTESFRDIY